MALRPTSYSKSIAVVCKIRRPIHADAVIPFPLSVFLPRPLTSVVVVVRLLLSSLHFQKEKKTSTFLQTFCNNSVFFHYRCRAKLAVAPAAYVDLNIFFSSSSRPRFLLSDMIGLAREWQVVIRVGVRRESVFFFRKNPTTPTPPERPPLERPRSGGPGALHCAPGARRSVESNPECREIHFPSHVTCPIPMRPRRCACHAYR